MTGRIAIKAGTCSYSALVGPLADAAESLRELAGERRLTAVTDRTVWDLHGNRLGQVIAVDPLFVPPGEAAKNWDVLGEVLAQFANRDLDRFGPVIAFGGGSIGDLTGLAAGLFKRGCPVIHVPTTLLAQVDSAIGGKTAIDFAGQKNIVGLFHQPVLVVADPGLLDTLDARQIRSGFVELVKYGLIADPPMLAWAEETSGAIIAGNLGARRRAVEVAIRSKASYVERDPEDRNGTRALLNLGHSFGHAIEASAGLGRVLHGEAVAIGITLAFQLSVELGLCPPSDVERVRHLFASNGLPTTLAEAGVDPVALPAQMRGDKKNVGGKVRLILVKGIGQAFVSDQVDDHTMADFLKRAA